MGKAYKMLLAGAALLAGTMTASATAVTLSWDTPGAIEVYNGSTSDSFKVQLAPDQTSIRVETSSTYGSVYIKAADGRVLTGIHNITDDTDLKVGTFGYSTIPGFAFNSSYSGKEFSITTEAIEFDGTFTVRTVNGPELVTMTMGGTGRNIVLDGGTQTVQLASKLETAIGFSIKNASDPYIKRNGETIEPDRVFYGTYTYNAIPVSAGDHFEIKGNDDPEIPDVVATEGMLTVTLAEGCGPEAILGLKDVSRIPYTDLAWSQPMELKLGTEVQLNLNPDYTNFSATLDGVDITSNIQKSEILQDGVPTGRYSYVSLRFTVDKAEQELVVSAAPIDWGTKTYTLHLVNPEGVKLTNNGQVLTLPEGAPDTGAYSFVKVTENGKLVDEAFTIEAGEATLYTLTLSAKDDKMFVDANEGWYLQHARAGFLPKHVDGMTQETELWIVARPIERTGSYTVVYNNSQEGVAGAVTASVSVRCKDGSMLSHQLVAGQENTIAFCPGYDDSNVFLRFTNMTDDNESLSEVYLNRVKQPNSFTDATSGMKSFSVPLTAQEGDVVRVYCNQKAQTAPLEVTSDNKRARLFLDNQEVAAWPSKMYTELKGTKVRVLPGEDVYVELDGTELRKNQQGFAEFNLTGWSELNLTYMGYANVPSYSPKGGSVLEELESIVVRFGNADTVEYIGSADEFTFRSSDNLWAPASLSVDPVEGSDNEFRISFSNLPTQPKEYLLMVPQGAFLIDGDLLNPMQEISYFIKKTYDELPLTIQPLFDKLATDPWTSPYATFSFCNFDPETYEMSDICIVNDLRKELIGEKVTVTFNDTAIPYAANPYEADAPEVCYTVECEDQHLMFNTYGLQDLPGVFTVTVAEGLFTVNGADNPELTHTWTYAEPKEYTHTLLGHEGDFVFRSLATVTLTIEAETAELNTAMGNHLTMRLEGNYSDLRSASFVKVEGPANVRRATAEESEEPATTLHTFRATFEEPYTASGNYEMTLARESFLLDGMTPYPDYHMTQKLTLGDAVGVFGVEIERENEFTVVGPDGRLLLVKASKEAVKALEPGLYIINGRKAVLK